MVVLLALLGGTGYYALPRASSEPIPFIPGEISLARPAIAQQTRASFLDTDAGMSAYSDTGRTINIDQARTAFRVVESETDSWIVGTVQAHDYDENEDPHVFVHTSGWIIAYYDKDSPVGRALHFVAPGTLGGSKLEDSLRKVANSAGAPAQSIGFYDFRFPEATEWLVIIDTNTFSVEIPTQFSVFEGSYSLTPIGSCGPALDIDGVRVATNGCTTFGYGGVSPSLLSTGSEHNVVVDGGSAAISLLYSPPSVQ